MIASSQFLSSLGPQARKLVQHHLTEVSLSPGDVIVRPYSKLEVAYFPINLTLVVDVEPANDAPFCTGLIGSDGLLGAGLSLDDRVCLYGVSVLAGGRAYVLPMSRLRDLLLEIPEFRKRALAYDQFFLAQVQQTAACSALHELLNRLSSWLLRLQSYAGDDLTLTQSRLSHMLGVRRTSITACATELQRIGAIEYKRGEIAIVNRKKLQRAACGCHLEISSHFARVFNESFEDE